MKLLKKALMCVDASGHFGTLLYEEKVAQELTLTANTHAEFFAVKHEIVELVADVRTYYKKLVGTDYATVNGAVCFMLQANERKTIVLDIGDVLTVISGSNGKANLVEKG